MIKVQCSKLEQVRANPNAFAQSLKDGNSGGGGSYGMFACWQGKVKEVHQEKLKIEKVVQALQQRFMTYSDNIVNRKKQAFLVDNLMPYFDAFSKQNFILEKSQINIQWEIVPGVSLTGHSPILVSNEELNVAYYFTENSFLWQTQLRFPLLQYYLAENFFECPLDRVKIGVYCLEEKSFSLQCFDGTDVNLAIDEAGELFGKIKQLYIG